MHADRTNRAMLILLALLLIAAGLFGALAGFGTFGSATRHGPLVSDQVSDYFGRHGDWLWPVIAAGAAIIALLSLRWLRALLLSTDRTGDLPLTGDRSAGRTTLAPAALADAVTGEISGYPGVRTVRARLIGDPLAPTLVIAATLEDGADLPGLRRRIEANPVRHARQALDDPDLPVRLDLTVTDRQGQRVS
ncbi:alkaline shock response membrane anchor protein AmaP [Jatrophihabitans sp.]|uniref:alkaline shock response membrane anchor protein AmaP n=1 Tax=Jatrophihabitans sp. TaxID=1932789 RepID=UPI002CE4E97B|nr:alkaline shock response membrane anchor protein AmaP [Jatrophihabitans sp.]